MFEDDEELEGLAETAMRKNIVAEARNELAKRKQSGASSKAYKRVESALTRIARKYAKKGKRKLKDEEPGGT